MDFIDNDLSKDEILNTYFTSIGTDLIDNNKLQDFCIGNKARQYARFIINEIPNLINTDVLSLVCYVNYFRIYILWSNSYKKLGIQRI